MASRPLIEPSILAASSGAAMTARMVMHPFDTIRLRIQTWPGQTLPPLRVIAPNLRTLYAGLPVSLAIGVPALSAYLTVYEAAKRVWTPLLVDDSITNPSMLQQFPAFMLAGLTAEITSGFVWTPLEVAKSRLQKGNDGTAAFPLFRKIVREEGVRGLFRGYLVSLAVFGPYTAMYWPVYEQMKTKIIPGYNANRSRRLTDDKQSQMSHRYALCAAVACTVSATLTHPIAVVQSKVQTSGRTDLRTSGYVKDTIKQMWAEGGWRLFTRGASARLIYMIPSSTISMTTFEAIKSHFGM